MLYAAGVWKGSIITGLDLVDVTLPEVATTENIQFRRGNLYDFPSLDLLLFSLTIVFLTQHRIWSTLSREII